MALTKVSSSLVSDNAITTGKLVDGGVHSADIATNAITSTKIAQNSILTKHIDDGQVTTAQLGADAVTAAKIADDAISEEHLDVTVITGLSEVTAATGDLLMVADISDSNNLKKIPVSSILAGTHTGPIGSGSNAVNVGTVTATGNLSMATDNATIFIGADLDLRLTHSGSAGTLTNNTGNLTLDVAGDIILDADGGNLKFADGGVIKLDIYEYNSNLYIDNQVSNSDIIFQGVHSSTSISALTLDMSNAGEATFSSSVTATGKYTAGNDASIFTFQRAGGAVSGNIEYNDATTDMEIGTTTAHNFSLKTANTRRLTISNAGVVEVGTLTSGLTGNVIINSEGGNPPALQVKSRTNRARINVQDNDTSGYIIAEGSVFSFGFADAVSANNININTSHNVGIGTTTPNSRFTVNTTTTGDGIELQSSEVSIAKLSRAVVNSNVVASLDGVSGRPIHIGGVVNEDVILANGGGKVGIGTASPMSPLHVKTTDQSIQIRNTGNANVGLEIYRDSDGAKGASIAWGNGNANLEIKNYRNDGQSGGPYANIDFFTGGTDADSPDFNPTRRMRIQQTGQVGIGVDDPISQLHVNKDTTGHNTDGITLGKVEANGWIDTDEEMGRLSWAASYGTGSSFVPAIGAYISAKADANWNLNEAPTRLGFFTAPENSLTPVERMRISKDGDTEIYGHLSFEDNKLLMFGGGQDARLYFDATTNALMITASNGTANTVNITTNNFQIGGATPLISGTANDSVVINQDGASNVDFRVESDNEQYNFFCDASSEIIHVGEGTNSDLQQVIPAKTLHYRRHGYHGGNRTHGGRTFKYAEGSSWTDAVKIEWNNASWGAVNMRIKGQGYYNTTDAFDVVISFQGHAAHVGGNFGATSVAGTYSHFINIVRDTTGETTIQQRNSNNSSNAEDIVFMYEWVTNNRSDQTILVTDL